ncbi:uncharacterized protein [Amphiura filiformis]|uniref:uncharacterized protein n=1 Tax=Amphiura filiformis TaxID=82378 RepID=UPI003B21233B
MGYFSEVDPHVVSACQNGYLTLDCGHHLELTAACQHNEGRKRYMRMGMIGDHRVLAMRDSGCDGVVVKADYVQPEQYTGRYRGCILIDRTIRIYPVAEVYIDTPFFVGKVLASVMKNPIRDLVVGNIPGVKDPEELPNPPDEREKAEIEQEMDTNLVRTSSQVTSDVIQQSDVVPQSEVKIGMVAEASVQLTTKAKPLQLPTVTDDEVVKLDISPHNQNDSTLRHIEEVEESEGQGQGIVGGSPIQKDERGIGVIFMVLIQEIMGILFSCIYTTKKSEVECTRSNEDGGLAIVWVLRKVGTYLQQRIYRANRSSVTTVHQSVGNHSRQNHTPSFDSKASLVPYWSTSSTRVVSYREQDKVR